MNNLFFLCFICCSIIKVYGQNLVVNSSFEELNYCETADPPVEVTIDACKAWTSVSYATPNHLNACHTSGGIFWSVPENSQGFQTPFEGESYAGLITAQDSSGGIIGNYREYIQSELFAPLTAEIEYSIGFWCSLGDKSALASNKLGLQLSEDAFGIVGSSFIELEAALESDTIFETENWVQIHGKYTAVGGEKFITLGNFNDFYHTDYAILDSNSFFADAYYYIDNVYVIDSSEHVAVDEFNVQEGIVVFPNPVTDFIQILSPQPSTKCEIELRSLQGEIMHCDYDDFSDIYKISMVGFPIGIYILTLKNGTFTKQWKIFKQ